MSHAPPEPAHALHTSPRITAVWSPHINFAQWQNRVPICVALGIEASSIAPLTDVTLEVSSSPALIVPKRWHIDAVAVGAALSIADVGVDIDGAHLRQLTEREPLGIELRLYDGAGALLTRLQSRVELLPRTHWAGSQLHGQLLAAFVQPNDVDTQKLVKRVAQDLETTGQMHGLSGYKDGPAHVWAMAQSAWQVVCDLALNYALPPPSFERLGQKVRTAGDIVESGLATCLDTTLLLCSMLEHCGLHPLIVLCEGHALAGVWLKDTYFDRVITDDAATLRKQVHLHTVMVFETTLVTQRPPVSFEQAVSRGAWQLTEPGQAPFLQVIDVGQARLQHIWPLNVNKPSVHSVLDAATSHGQTSGAAGRDPLAGPSWLVAPEPAAADPQRHGPATDAERRLEAWKTELLDLTLRNVMLNMPKVGRLLGVIAPDVAKLEDWLASGNELRLLAAPELTHTGATSVPAQQRDITSILRDLALQNLPRGQVYVDIAEDELDRRLTALFRDSRTLEQEGGANPLHLALGALRWRKDAAADRDYMAPLILLPVALTRKSVGTGYSLKLRGDEARFNPTLLEMLRRDFKLSLPIDAEDLSKDAQGIDVAAIWHLVAQAVANHRGWEVVSAVRLGLFSFSRFLLWKDLNQHAQMLERNAVVHHLLHTPQENFPSGVAFTDVHALDQTLDPARLYCPLPADSSQLAAVDAAARGKDFVLIGPPGTGKSQTIANIIAQCIADNKRVLFVAAKIEALNVVYKRLDKVGLSPFCLSLHSNKTAKADVLAQLKCAWQTTGTSDTVRWQADAERLMGRRAQLNAFVQALHQPYANGMTAYIAIGRILAHRTARKLALQWPDAQQQSRATWQTLHDAAEQLQAGAAMAQGEGQKLRLITRTSWLPAWGDALTDAALALLKASEDVGAAAEALARATGLAPAPLGFVQLQRLADLVGLVVHAKGQPYRFAVSPERQAYTVQLRDAASQLASYHSWKAKLSAAWPTPLRTQAWQLCRILRAYARVQASLTLTYSPAAEALDAKALRATLQDAQQCMWPKGPLQRFRIGRLVREVTRTRRVPKHLSQELDVLVSLQGLREELALHAQGAAAFGPLWRGLETDVISFEAVAALQEARAMQRDVTPDARARLESGQAGPQAVQDLYAWERSTTLSAALETLIPAGHALAPLWQGAQTSTARLDDAIAFAEHIHTAMTAFVPDAAGYVAMQRVLAGFVAGHGAPPRPLDALAQAHAVLSTCLTTYAAAATALQALAHDDPAPKGLGVWPTALLAPPEAVMQTLRGIIALRGRLSAWCSWQRCTRHAKNLGLGLLVDAIDQTTILPEHIVPSFMLSHATWWLNAVVAEAPCLQAFVAAEQDRIVADFRTVDDAITEATTARIRQILRADLPALEASDKASAWGHLAHELEKRRGQTPVRKLLETLGDVIGRLTPCMMMSPLSAAQYLSPDVPPFDVVIFDEASQIRVSEGIGALARGKQVIMVGDPKQMPPSSFFDRVEQVDEDPLGADDAVTTLESILDQCISARLSSMSLRWHYRSRDESLIAFSNQAYYQNALTTFPSPKLEAKAIAFHPVQGAVWMRGKAGTNKVEAQAMVGHIVAFVRTPAAARTRPSLGVVAFNKNQALLIEDLLDAQVRAEPELGPALGDGGWADIFVKNLESVQGDERDIIYFSMTYAPGDDGRLSMQFGPMASQGGERRLNVAITRARMQMHIFASFRAADMDLNKTQARGMRDLKNFLAFAEQGPRALIAADKGSLGSYDSVFEEEVAQALRQKGYRVVTQVGVSSFRIDLAVVDPRAPGSYLAGVECDGYSYHASATARDRDKIREQVLRDLGWNILRVWSTDWWHDHAHALEKLLTALEALVQTPSRDEVPQASTLASVEQASPPASVLPHQATGEAETPTSTLAPDAFFEAHYEVALQGQIKGIVAARGPLRSDTLARLIAQMHGWQRTGAKIKARVDAVAALCCGQTHEDVGVFYWPTKPAMTHKATFRPPEGTERRTPAEVAIEELTALAHKAWAQTAQQETALSYMAEAGGWAKLSAVSRERLQAALTRAAQQAGGRV